jgi:hypothetical protein
VLFVLRRKDMPHSEPLRKRSGFTWQFKRRRYRHSNTTHALKKWSEKCLAIIPLARAIGQTTACGPQVGYLTDFTRQFAGSSQAALQVGFESGPPHPFFGLKRNDFHWF